MVYHYHVTGWPDHGVPQDPGEILGLLSEVHMKQKVAAMKNSPILLHCRYVFWVPLQHIYFDTGNI